jgi:hypothetical protein
VQFFAELGEVLHQVVGEGIVVVDHQQHVRSILLIPLGVFLSPTFHTRFDTRFFCRWRGRRDLLGGD